MPDNQYITGKQTQELFPAKTTLNILHLLFGMNNEQGETVMNGINNNDSGGGMTLREAQNTVDQWIKEYGVRYFSELTNMACLTEEVGELARIMARRYGDQSFKEGEKTDPGEEIADVLWVLLCLANQTGVDVEAELRKSIGKKTRRDCKRHINNPKLK